MTAWVIFGIGATLEFAAAVVKAQSTSLLLTMVGSVVAGLAAMYLFPWYAVKHVLQDQERERRELERED